MLYSYSIHHSSPSFKIVWFIFQSILWNNRTNFVWFSECVLNFKLSILPVHGTTPTIVLGLEVSSKRKWFSTMRKSTQKNVHVPFQPVTSSPPRSHHTSFLPKTQNRSPFFSSLAGCDSFNSGFLLPGRNRYRYFSRWIQVAYHQCQREEWVKIQINFHA